MIGNVAELMEAHGPCTSPLDTAAEYLRVRILGVLPMYVWAMTPHAIIVILLINAIVAEQRSLASDYCLFFVAATLWRWVWLARLQYIVDQDLRDRRLLSSFWLRLPQILFLRLLSNFAITWGSFLAGVPTFYGLYVGSFATPLIMENDDAVIPRLRQSLTWIQNSGSRLLKVAAVMSVVAVTLTLGIFVAQLVLVHTILPTLLDVNPADLQVTIDSWAWWLSVAYFIFLILDFYWTIAAVILYYDSQSRRMATDLRARLLNLTEAAP